MTSKFKALAKGVQRAIIAGTLVGASIIGGVIGALNEYTLSRDEFFGYSIFLGIPIYWACVFVGLWIYEGFKTDK